MAKLVYTEKASDGHNVHYIAGNVSFVNFGTGEYEGKVVNVGMTLDTFNPKTREREKKLLTVSFWNSGKHKLADRIRSAKVRAGVFLLIKCGELRDAGVNGDGVQKLNAYGFRFKYNEIVHLGDDLTLICGTIRRTNKSEFHWMEMNGDRLIVSVPIKTKTGETEWYSIHFINGDVNEKTRKIAERAARYGLSDGMDICALCGPVDVVEGGNTTFRNLYAYDFSVGYRVDPKEEA